MTHLAVENIVELAYNFLLSLSAACRRDAMRNWDEEGFAPFRFGSVHKEGEWLIKVPRMLGTKVFMDHFEVFTGAVKTVRFGNSTFARELCISHRTSPQLLKTKLESFILSSLEELDNRHTK